jgi:hypothetical protein
LRSPGDRARPARGVRPPRRPAAIRTVNGIGRALGAIGVPLARLDAKRLLDRARRRTGLSDFGGGAFREPLGVLLDAFESEAALSPIGRWAARSDVLRLLENRLRMVDTWKRYPEIAEGAIRRPIFILGLPRTGTTILHALLAEDPRNRVPLTWEVMHPWPPPEAATHRSDPRIARVEKHLAGVDRLIPGFQAMHPMGALLPQECVALTAHDFATMIYHTTHRVPSYQAWLDAADLRPVYASHRRQLQYLQWRCPGERWVLKSPGHLWALDALLHEYPDARIIQTHRDPLQVVASLTSLVTLLRTLSSDRVDPLEIAIDWTRRLAQGLQRTMRVREGGLPAEARVVDLPFADLMADPFGAIRGVYERFGLDLEAPAEARMRRFLAANPQDKHGAHRYRFEDTGLALEVERRRFAAYADRFAVPPEVGV